MKRVFVALIAGTVLSGAAAAYSATAQNLASRTKSEPAKNDTLETKSHKLAASD